MHKRLIKISKNRFFYTPDDYLELSASNFPVGTIFSERADIFWVVDLVHFDKNKKILEVKVLDYFPDNTLSFEAQSLKSGLNKIEFKDLEASILYSLLSAYSPMDFTHLIKKGSDEASYQSPFLKPKKEDTDDFDLEMREFIQPLNESSEAVKTEKTFVHYQKIKHYFKEAEFKLGYVEIKKRFPFLSDRLTLKIYNSNILPEYNYIKSFFPRAFKNKKKFSIEVKLEILGNKLLHYTATSKEINAINDKLIGIVKQLRTLQMLKTTVPPEIDQSLFTADEVFENTKDEGLDHNVFKDNEADILNQLLESKDIRNKKQLQYLAGLKQSSLQKIRITLSPIFGFLFFIEGEKMYHYCWELLNSHATYLWSFDKMEDSKVSLMRVQESINIIRDMGRKKYKQAYREHNIGDDLLFSIINHKHANSAFKDGFVHWKHRFKECLV